MSAYQRSSDANLGLPADLYHLYLISRQIDLPPRPITLNIGNVHIYETNIENTRKLLSGAGNVKLVLNVWLSCKQQSRTSCQFRLVRLCCSSARKRTFWFSDSALKTRSESVYADERKMYFSFFHSVLFIFPNIKGTKKQGSHASPLASATLHQFKHIFENCICKQPEETYSRPWPNIILTIERPKYKNIFATALYFPINVTKKKKLQARNKSGPEW